jgi:hypothetical protein
MRGGDVANKPEADDTDEGGGNEGTSTPPRHGGRGGAVATAGHPEPIGTPTSTLRNPSRSVDSDPYCARLALSDIASVWRVSQDAAAYAAMPQTDEELAIARHRPDWSALADDTDWDALCDDESADIVNMRRRLELISLLSEDGRFDFDALDAAWERGE